MIRNTLSLAALAVLVALPLAAHATGTQPAEFEQRYQRLQQIASSDDVDPGLSATLLAMVEDARDQAGDRERFLAVTNDIGYELLVAGSSEAGMSAALCEQFVPAYVAAFEVVTEFEWGKELHKFAECDADFDCSTAFNLCLQVWWRDGNGSGGINCLSL